MGNRTRLLIGCLLAAALGAASAEAKVVCTPPVRVATGITAWCSIQNVSTKSRHVDITILDEAGVTNTSQGADVGPGAAGEYAGVTEALGYAYCCFDGLTKSVRGYLTLRDATSTLVVLNAEK